MQNKTQQSITGATQVFNSVSQVLQQLVSIKKDKTTKYYHVMLGNVSMYKNTNKALCSEWKEENFPSDSEGSIA